MVIGIGTDIIEIRRIAEAVKRPGFTRRVFTPEELRTLADKNPENAAANFAAKESVAKAMGTGFRGFGPADIEILRDNRGKPIVFLYNKAKEIAERAGAAQILITMSHCREYAVAYALILSK